MSPEIGPTIGSPRTRLCFRNTISFPTRNGYYQTALHEVGHSTGHPDRMNRESLQQGIEKGFGSPEYAREELRAEISAITAIQNPQTFIFVQISP